MFTTLPPTLSARPADTINQRFPEKNIIQREPVGVVGVISPWNVPLKLSIRAVAPAIALGNSVVLKPAEETSISGGLLLAKLFEMAGLPDGVLNVVPGDGPTTGDRVASHPDCEVMAFTGSTAAGRLVGENVVSHFGFPGSIESLDGVEVGR